MFRFWAVLLVAVSGLAACSSSHAATSAATTAPVPNAGATVQMRNIAFVPRSVTIRAGQAVVWDFTDSVPHNVTGQGYASTTRSRGTFSHTFPTPGTYTYTCTVHSGMDGTVVVSS